MTGPEGSHVRLVYEPMREPLWLFQRRCKGGKLSLPLLKVYLTFLLRGLDYLHSECHVVHIGMLWPRNIFNSSLTLVDLKPDNILVGFEDGLVINDLSDCKSLIPWLARSKMVELPIDHTTNLAR